MDKKKKFAVTISLIFSMSTIFSTAFCLPLIIYGFDVTILLIELSINAIILAASFLYTMFKQ